jgi:ribosomal protein L22
MSAEDEKENETPGDAPVQPAAEASQKPSRARKASAKGETPEESTAEEPAAKKPAAKKRAAKAEKPAEVEEPSAEADQPPTAEAEDSSAGTAEPAAEADPEAKKPAKARRSKKAAPAADEQPTTEPVAEVAPTEEAPAEEAAPEPKPAVAAKRKPAERRQVVHAKARYVRTSARKARMVCGHIRGKSVPEARAILAFTPRDVARDWSKLLESAVANAENNHELLEDDLVVREAYADEGPTIKRFRPRAMGRATPIRKRTSHLTITLTPRS